MLKFRCILVLLVFGQVTTWAKGGMPSWYQNAAVEKLGSVLSVRCSGVGPSQDLSMNDAVKSCHGSASEQAVGVFNVRSLTLQTEETAAYHSEVSSDLEVRGLRCDVRKVETVEVDGSFMTFLLCRYDLTKVSARESKKTHTKQSSLGKADRYLDAPGEVGQSTAKTIIKSTSRQVLLTTIPRCDSVLISGGDRPRPIHCKQSPVPLLIHPSDQELTIRAKGFLPRTINLESEKSIDPFATETMEVHLERQ